MLLYNYNRTLLYIILLITILPAQKHFGRIFKENKSPFLIQKTRQDTTDNNIELLNNDPDLKEEKNNDKIDNKFQSDLIKRIIDESLNDTAYAISKSKPAIKKVVNTKTKIKNNKPFISIDSIKIINNIYYIVNTNQLYSGRIIDNWQNGNQKIEIRVKSGLKHGSSKEWYENGNKKYTSAWKNDTKNGYYREWYDNAQPKIKGKYYDGKKHETWITYYPNGQINKQINYIDGVPSGSISIWYSNGQLKENGVFKATNQSKYNNPIYQKDGIWKHYYLNGQLKEKGLYTNGLKHAEWKQWYENGEKKSEGYFKQNKRHGGWAFWFDDGNKKAKGNYFNDELNGQWTRWYEWIWKYAANYTKDDENPLNTLYIDGQIRVVENWKDGLKNGIWTWWNKAGYIDSTGAYNLGRKSGKWTSRDTLLMKEIESNWFNGKQKGIVHHKEITKKKEELNSILINGKKTEWYANGKIKSKKHYVNGKKHGLWTYWFSNGNKSIESSYENNKKDGKWKYYYLNGKERKLIYYKNNLKNGKTIIWYNNGNKEKEFYYSNDILNGKIKKWYDNSQLRVSGQYDMGTKKGKWKYWYYDGKTRLVNVYK